jgi:hypothetical protein
MKAGNPFVSYPWLRRQGLLKELAVVTIVKLYFTKVIIHMLKLS